MAVTALLSSGGAHVDPAPFVVTGSLLGSSTGLAAARPLCLGEGTQGRWRQVWVLRHRMGDGSALCAPTHSVASFKSNPP